MRALVKHPLFDCDLEEAALWYNARNPAVAERLILQTEKAIRLAALDPLRFPILFGENRRIRIPGFPHALYFQVLIDSVWILALIHGSRDAETLLVGRTPPN